MTVLQRTATFAFSLLLHGSIATAGFLFATAENFPEENIYHVSLAEFAPASTSITPGEEETATPAKAEHQPEAPLRQVEPEVVPPPPKTSPIVTPKPALDRLVPQSQKRREPPLPQERESKVSQVSVPELQSAVPAQLPERTDGGVTQGGPQTVGGLSAYAEDAVEQRPSIFRRAMPEYPDRARRMSIQGKVIVQLVVDVTGKPQQCVILSSDPAGIFDQAVLAAAGKIRFIPGKIKGQPVNTIVLIPYQFTLR